MFVFIKLMVNMVLNLEQSPLTASLHLGRSCLCWFLSFFDIVVPSVLYLAAEDLVCFKCLSWRFPVSSFGDLKRFVNIFEYALFWLNTHNGYFRFPAWDRGWKDSHSSWTSCKRHAWSRKICEDLDWALQQDDYRGDYPMIHIDINGEYEGINVDLKWSVTYDQSISPKSTFNNSCELAMPAAPLLETVYTYS